MALSRGCRPHFHPPAGLPRREILAGGRGSIPRGGAAADRLFRGLRLPLSSLCQRLSPRVGEQPPPPCATSTALCSYQRTFPACTHSTSAFLRLPPSPACVLAGGSASRGSTFRVSKGAPHSLAPTPPPLAILAPLTPLWTAARLPQLLGSPPSPFWPPSPPSRRGPCLRAQVPSSTRREAKEDPPHDPCRAQDPPTAARRQFLHHTHSTYFHPPPTHTWPPDTRAFLSPPPPSGHMTPPHVALASEALGR